MSYLELDTEYEGDDIEMLRDEIHRFAKEEVRPAAVEMDRMERSEYLDIPERGSVYWDVMKQIKELGLHRAMYPEEVGGDGISGKEFHVVMEELGWGSPGLAIAFGVDLLPGLFGVMAFDDELEEEFINPYLEDTEAEYQGCWGVTEPSHGSELVMGASLLREGVSEQEKQSIGEPEITAEPDDDGWRINGVKSSWVSAAPMATHCALHTDMDPAGGSPGYAAVVPLDNDGVTRGPPIDKLGQRDCPQGELVFDDVWIPDSHMIMTPEMLHPETGYVPITQVLCITSTAMAAVSTGLARAAFEEALAYAREREQGGKRIAEHQSVKAKLYKMFEKVETSRTYSRRIAEHVHDSNVREFEFNASHRHALAAQVYCKRTAFEVAHEAMQIHGANGITKDYLVEKLFRDARVKLIEDGTTEVLGLESAEGVIENYEVG